MNVHGAFLNFHRIKAFSCFHELHVQKQTKVECIVGVFFPHLSDFSFLIFPCWVETARFYSCVTAPLIPEQTYHEGVKCMISEIIKKTTQW